MNLCKLAVSLSDLTRFALLIFSCQVCSLSKGVSQRFERAGDIVTYKGNKFELSKAKIDTIITVDKKTGDEVMKIIMHDQWPVKMNGMPIPEKVDKHPAFTGIGKNLGTYLLQNMKDELSKLGDGGYRLNLFDILIDQNGKVVYFDYEALTPAKNGMKISPAIIQEIYSKLSLLLDSAALLQPGTLKGKNVVSQYTDTLVDSFAISTHKLTMLAKGK